MFKDYVKSNTDNKKILAVIVLMFVAECRILRGDNGLVGIAQRFYSEYIPCSRLQTFR